MNKSFSEKTRARFYAAVCQISLEIFDVKQIYSQEKSKYLNSIRVFLSDYNWIRIQNHLVGKRTLNHVAKPAK